MSILLIFISKLFRGGLNEWEVHLDALALIVSSIQDLRSSKPKDLISGSSSLTSTAQTREATLNSSTHDIRNTAEEFLTGVTVWFDIVSCASTGKAPRLANIHEIIFKTGTIDMVDIAGCQSWVALLIGQTATLHTWKEERIAEDNLSMWDLFERAAPIRQQLAQHIAQLRKDIDDSFSAIGHVGTIATYLIMANPSLHALALVRAVTLVYAYAAQVYLNTVISGSQPCLDEIRSSVHLTVNAIEELRTISDSQILRSLLWPICIAGSMAENVDSQSYFRDLIQTLGDEAHDFGNSKTVLNVMEKCWTSRNDGIVNTHGRGWNWLAAMEASDQRVLLV